MSKKFLLYAAQNYAYAILRPLQQAILARGDQVKWFLKGDEINADYLTENEQQLLGIDDVIDYQPDVVLVPGNVVPDFIPGLKVQVFHGFNVEKRSDSRGHFNIRGCFDLYCTQGPNTTEKFVALAKELQHFSVKETGWPAIDLLYSQTHQTPQDKPTILLCSTFTPSLSCAETLFDTVKNLSKNGCWRWLVQFHPKMATSTVAKYQSIESEDLTFIETDNVIPLLQQADVMVCDTSSVMSMFLLLSKPVVTFKTANPKPYLLDITETELLEQTIDYALQRPTDVMQKVTSFIEQTHPYNDGKSSERVLAAVDEMLAGNDLPAKRKPWNLIRSLKMRKKLGYWKW